MWSIIVVLSLFAAAPPPELVFYNDFEDRGAMPVRIDPDSAWHMPEGRSIVLREGRFGRGLFVGDDGGAPSPRIDAAALINPHEGTIMFWVRTAWGDAPDDRMRYLLTIVNNSTWDVFNLMVARDRRSVTFSNWLGRWSYAPSAPMWRDGGWHHVAMVWRARDGRLTKTIVIDGEVAAEATEAMAMIDVGVDQPHVVPGSFNGNAGTWADATIDELSIWTAALDVEQIAELSRQSLAQRYAGPMAWLPRPRPVGVTYRAVEPADFTIHQDQTLRFELAGEPPGRVRLCVEDFYGRERDLGMHAMGATSIAADGFGVFKLHVEADDGRRSELLTFACVPRQLAEREPPADSSFGNHVQASEQFAGLARKLGVCWTMIKDGPPSFTNWFIAEPQPDAFQWFDDRTALLRAHGLTPVGCVFRTPRWASTAPAGAPDRVVFSYPPGNFADFGDVMFQLADHYRGTIDHWELWNEPHVTAFWTGTATQYVELVAVGADAVRRANPRATVIGGSLSLWDETFVDEAVEAGLLEHIDVLSIHGYSDAFTPQGESAMATRVDALRRKMRALGLPRPIWITEHSTHSMSFFERYWPKFPSQRQSHHYRAMAAQVVREHVMAVASGVDKVFFYWFWHQGHDYFQRAPINGAMTEPTGAPKPLAVAYALLAWRIDGARFVGETSLAGGKAHGYVFERDDRAVAVLWATGAPTPIDIAGSWFDLMGTPLDALVALDREPRYLIVDGAGRGDALLATLRGE